MPNINFVRAEVQKQLAKWEQVTDCLGGQTDVKYRRERYLPRPNPEDNSSENRKRYQAYLERAVFYNVTRRTLDGLVGQVFIRNPVREFPVILEVLNEDADGAGVGIDQQAKKALEFVMSHGRCGLLADYPTTDRAITKAEQEAGFTRPTVNLYRAEAITNWRTITIGAKKMLSLVVLRDSRIKVKEDDEFTVETETFYRVLRLVGSTKTDPGEYSVEIWASDGQAPESTMKPLDGEGKPLKFIPFTFIGPRNNDEFVDDAPLYDLAVMNIAHYRNSADYEESCFLVGQPTPWLSGVTMQWVKEVWKGKVVLGSRSAIALPEQGQAGLLQVDPNSMPKEAMEHKERQMVALGAKLVEQKTVQRTLGEAQLEEAAESSILSTAAKNVGSAYTTALKWCSSFAATDGEVKYELNTDFPAARMSSEERAELVAEWQANAISYSEMRNQLKKAGVATLTDEEAKDEIESMPISITVPPAAALKAAPPGTDPNTQKAGPKASGKSQIKAK